jgi:DNA-binding NtrC family response regulator
MTHQQSSICVVDDDISSREAIVHVIRSAGFRVREFASAQAFLANTERELVDCLVLDVVMPGLGGLALQEKLNSSKGVPPIVFVTGHGDIPTSVSAIKAGAVDFLTKPFDDVALLGAVRSALELRPQQRTDGTCVQDGVSDVSGLVHANSSLQQVICQVKTVGPTQTTVLIQGETGTGKERIARAVHECSDRREGPFIKVNCAAIPAGLLESELMGHERGAFTGAVAQRIGRFELAHNGTIFLDEIGELPMDIQPKLLRVLQEREFERVGGTRTVRSNARVVAATNRDLRAMVGRREFREDLYYRLSVFPIAVPPLRERKRDIGALATHFVGELAQRMKKHVRPLTQKQLDQLAAHSWPGNIRELQNVLERAVILAMDGQIVVPALEAPEWDNDDDLVSDALADVSKAHITRVLDDTNWVVAGPNGAAARLRMKRSTLNYRMKQLGIVRPSLRTSS